MPICNPSTDRTRSRSSPLRSSDSTSNIAEAGGAPLPIIEFGAKLRLEEPMKVLVRVLLCCVLATGLWAQRGGGGARGGGGGHSGFSGGGGSSHGGAVGGGFRGGGGL